ncbi:MAG: hypothetical protein IKU26_00475 [Clostridia bacterium]|nr:hypothetical protein [Clostridia bacterium]
MMNVSKVFTEALVEYQEKHEGLERGYDERNDYLKKDTSWAQLRKGMSPAHEKQFGAGSGGELEPKDGKPPKMAAFASSSRMIYTLSTQKDDIPGIRFEEKLSTTIGGTANMDGYLEQDGKYIFVEAKCREPYDHTTVQTVKTAYKNLYEQLRKSMPGIFSCVMEEREEENDMRVVFLCQGEAVAYFDIKQMICHLLGVATKFLKPTDCKGLYFPEFEQIQFLYLLYDPSSLALTGAKRDAVMQIYRDTCRTAQAYHFEQMFAHVVDYLVAYKTKKNKPVPDEVYLNRLKKAFTFHLCSQEDYNTYFI